MRRLLVLGAGTAGTIVVNKLRHRLARDEWDITVVDQSDRHFYQPGYLFVPFGVYSPEEIVKPRQWFIPHGVALVHGEIDRVAPDSNEVLLADGRRLPYDYLVIATGVEPRPDQTPGLFDGGEWRKSIFDFYTLDGAVALREALAGFGGGRLAVHMLANAALGEGVETHLFFTFWGFDMITKSRMRLWACRMSADMMHLTGDDLYEEVEGIINAADFIEKTDGAQLLFI